MPRTSESLALERHLPSDELRRLWQEGKHAAAIRGALARWEELLTGDDDLGWLQQALRSVGLLAEAFALQAQATRRQARAKTWETLIRGALHSGDPWWARELLVETGGGSRELQALAIEAELALGDAAPLISSWVNAYDDAAARESAVGWWVRAGDIAEAERLLADTTGLPLWRARFALWRRQPAAARSSLQGMAPSPAVRCLLAVAAIQEGRLAEAEALLRTLLDTEVQAEAWGWLAAVLRKRKSYAEAVRAADAANAASMAFNLALRLERELSTDLGAAPAPSPSTLSRLLARLGRRVPRPGAMRTIGMLRHGWALSPFGLKPEDSVACVEALLDSFGGNYTSDVTTVDGDRLTFHRLPPDPGQVGASVQRVLGTRGLEAARTVYRQVAAETDNHPSFRIFQGELELWAGAYPEAEDIFREALDRDLTVKWAWIGLGASMMLQDRFDEAQQAWQRGVSIAGAGPTLSVYRGECYRRQGRPLEARRALEQAVREKPHRLSAWINLALVARPPDAAEQVARVCQERLPLLMAELSGSPAERLEGVLQAMRGNRSSTRVTYHLWGRLWQAVTHGAVDVPGLLSNRQNERQI